MQRIVNWFATKIKRLVSIWYEFLQKGLSEQALEAYWTLDEDVINAQNFKIFRNKLLRIPHSVNICENSTIETIENI